MIAYILICISTIIAGFTQASLGFGSGIVIMIFLPTLFPIAESAAISSSITMVLSALMVRRYSRFINLKKVVFPAIIYSIASVLSIYYSGYIHATYAKIGFGIFLLSLSVYQFIFANKNNKDLGYFKSLIFIILSGIFSGLFGIGGPLMAIYFLKVCQSKEEYLGITQLFFISNSIFSLLTRISTGILEVGHMPIILIGIVGILCGFWLSNRFIRIKEITRFKIYIYQAVGIVGIFYIMQGFLK
ncbi:sulfite exporter TauE/SafE family protein [Streptococcus moroccensis]|uniref:Probable membrane transporter protein n=1 Tax=Streptococcus moroccensis TaxID=1451356 RepID=A0ABT9YS52_9STRE|nr:sulfite exporter TauE/SafE family protein [Streptococcus moroccensis]MDQ0222600.1 putative membrane protein YfcA [Streptococcus moroccensis]